ncbi:MAG: ABC transporter permease [Planctomycetota bacterium]
MKRAKTRSLLTIGSVAIAIFLFCMLRTVITSINATVSGDVSTRVISQSAVSLFVNLPVSMWTKIRSTDGVRSVTHWTWFGGIYKEPKNFFAQFATDPVSFREVYGDRHPAGGEYSLTEEEWQAWEDERTSCIIGRDTAEKFQWKVGDTVPLAGTIYPGEFRFVIRGIYTSNSPAFDEATLFFHWDYLDEAMGGLSTVSTYTADLESPDLAPTVALAVDETFRNSANRTRTLTERAFQAQFVSMWGNYTVFLSFIGGAVLIAAFMVTLNTLLLNARERITEVGVLKTLGFPDSSIGLLNLAEAVALCALGGLIGCGMAMAAEPFFAKLLVQFVPDFRLLPETLGVAVAIAVGLGLVSGAVPGFLAARVPVVQALRRIA